MKVTNVHERIKENYVDEIIERLEFYKSKGYILVKDRNTLIYHYTVEKGFVPVGAVFEFIAKLTDEAVNYFKVPVNDIDINKLIEKTLPVVTLDELKALDRCCNIMKEFTNEDDVKQELKELKELHKNRSSNLKIGSNPKDPTTQAAALNSEFVVYSTISKSWFESSSFYRWDKKEKKFIQLTLEGVHNILLDYFKVSKVEITYADVKRNREKYAKELINTEVPLKWNKYARFNNDLKKYKKELKLYNNIMETII